MCFVAGSFGVDALCAHTIAYNMIPLLYMIPLGFSIGLTVRMGHTLARGQVETTKRIAAWCMGAVVILGAIVAVMLYLFRDSIIGLFIRSDDHPLVMERTQQIWPMVSMYIFVLYIFGINGAILKGLGMQWRLASIIFGCLWCGLLPGVVYISIVRHGGLTSQWMLLPTCYVIMQACLVVSYTTVDWHDISRRTMSRLAASSSRSLADVMVVVGGGTDHDEERTTSRMVDEMTPLVSSTS
jgi:Na+-driven multidrug efflux pump